MSNQISTQTLSFYGSELITLKVEDVIYTAVRPIVEALGLSWSTQNRKLENSKDKFGCVHMNTPTNGGMQTMLCMPLKKLNGWLFSINPEKVRPDLKDRVIQYQEECFEALYNYWHFGKAERKTTTDERTGLRQAVSALVSKKGLIYSDAYSLIHQRFNVEHID
ncbi:phage antirepressor N-terminal domain-containing protein, partial [Glaesserella parasuis]